MKQSFNRQRGASNIKAIAIVVGVGLMLAFIVFVATSTPNSSTDDSGQTTDTTAEGETSSSPVKLPEGFKTITNKQYGISVAFPETWGSLTITSPANSSILQTKTKEVTYPLGSSKMFGNFSVSAYPLASFEVTPRFNGQTLSPSKNGDNIEWKVIKALASDPKYPVGSTYPVKSVTNPAGVVLHNFSRALDNRRQSAWAYESKDKIIFIALPPLETKDGTSPTGADLTSYDTFAKSVTDTITIPK